MKTLRRMAVGMRTLPAPALIYNHQADTLTSDVHMRMHSWLVAADESTPIGVEPTPMWETGNASQVLKVEPTAMRVSADYEEIEEFMAEVLSRPTGLIIYDFSDTERETLEEMCVNYLEDAPL